MVLGTGSHSASGASGAILRRMAAHAGVETNTRSDARATMRAMTAVTDARTLWRIGCDVSRGNITSWNIAHTDSRRPASQRQNGMFMPL